MTTVTRIRTILLAISMIIGPVFLLVGHLLTVPADEEPKPWVHDIQQGIGIYVFAQSLIAIGAILLIVNCVGLMRLAPARGGVLVTIGSVLLGAAAIGLGIGNGMFGILLGTLAPSHPGVAVQVATIAADANASNLPWALAPLLPIGIVVIAVGLLLARTAPIWLPITFAVGGLLFFVSGSGGLYSFVLLLPLAVGMAGLGVVVGKGARASSGIETADARPDVAAHPTA